MSAIDVVGHEFTHGVTNHTSALIYQAESGALNESFSDIFGVMVERSIQGSEDWLHRDDTGSTNRSLQNPNALGQPDTYNGTNWASTANPSENNDWGGVHTNSGVQNYWFFLLANGGSDTNDDYEAYNVQGIGITDAARIAYQNLTQYLQPSSDFADAREGAINAAIALFGECSQQHISTMNAWHAVGVGDPFTGVCASTIYPNYSSLCIDDPYIYESFWLTTFPANAQVSWNIPWPIDYTLSNNNHDLTITGINYPFPAVYTITATITGSGGSVTRWITINVQDCGGMLKSAKITDGVKPIEVSVSPNPAIDILNVNLINKKPDVVYEIELTDSKGVIVRNLTTKNNVATLNTLNLPDGIYLLRTKCNDKITVNKVVVTH